MGEACVCVCVCVGTCKHVYCARLCFACVGHSLFCSLQEHTHPLGYPTDFVSVSLYCNFISVMSAAGGPGEEGVFVF